MQKRESNICELDTCSFLRFSLPTNTEPTEDLSSLGKVAKVRFNMTGGPDNGYGFSMPAYYALDDITIEL